MRVILTRSRSIDSAVFKLAETLSKNGHKVTLLIWDRQNDFKMEKEMYNVHKFSLKAPYDKLTALFYLPFWWIYEFYFYFPTKQMLFMHAILILYGLQ